MKIPAGISLFSNQPAPVVAGGTGVTSEADANARSDLEAEERAYNTSLTLEQLRERLSASRASRDALGRNLTEALGRLHGLGRLVPPSGVFKGGPAEEEAVLSACLMGRLNPHLFPGTPQV